MNDLDPSATEPRIRKIWLITFADLLCLVLTFFVLLFSMQKIDNGRWAGVANSLSRSLDPDRATSESLTRAEHNAGVVSPRRAADLGYLETLLVEKAREDPALRGAAVRLLDDRLVVALPSELLFARGSAEIGEGARTALYGLGTLLANIGNSIAVEGHDDPDQVATGPFRSNRALSLARALAVAAALREMGYSRDIAATGFGASRFSELAGIEPRERRYQLARRVDLVIRPYRGAL